MSTILAQKSDASLRIKFQEWVNTPITVGVLLEWELYLVTISCFLHSFGLPTVVNDILCFFNLLLFVFSLRKMAQVFNRHPAVVCLGLALLTYSGWTALYNGVSPLNSVWQFITFSRPFVYGFLALAYWDADRFDSVLHRFIGLQWVNGACAALQFLVLGLYQDRVGGIFGFWLGCNLPLNIYLCVVTVAMFSAYLNKHWNVSVQALVASCLCSLGVAAVAELKFFFIEFILILICAFFLCKPTMKKFALMLLALFVFVAGFSLFSSIFPDRAANMLNFDTLYGEANLRGAGYPISRIEVYEDLSRILFSSDPMQQVIGLGLGASASSSIEIFTSPLSVLYADYRFGLLQSVMLCVDLGYIGTVLYIGFLVSFGVCAWRDRAENRFLSLFSIIVIILFIGNIYYNNTASSANSIFWALPLVCFLSQTTKRRNGNIARKNGKCAIPRECAKEWLV